LTAIKQYEKLEELFHNILLIGNVRWFHFIDELEDMRKRKSVNAEIVRDMYHQIRADVLCKKDRDDLR